MARIVRIRASWSGRHSPSLGESDAVKAKRAREEQSGPELGARLSEGSEDVGASSTLSRKPISYLPPEDQPRTP